MKRTNTWRSTAGALALLFTAAPAAAQYVPDGDIRFVVPFGAGGGSDVLARTIVSVIDDLDLIPNNLIVENRVGGSGAIGYNYIASQRGDAQVIGTVSVSFFTTPLLGNSPVNYEDFTPIAAIAMSPYIAVVRAESAWETLEDLAAETRLTTGSVGVVSDAALLSSMLATSSNTQIDVVPFDGVGEAVSATLGGHVDFYFGSPGEVMPQIEAGALRPLVVSGPERMESLPDVPTFSEAGHAIEHVQLRGIVMPKDITEEAAIYWEDIFRQVAESDAWATQYLDRFGDQPRFRDRNDFAVDIAQTNQLYADMFDELGIGQ